MEIKRQYIVDDHNRRVAVQLDIATFEKIEEVLESRALYEMMRDTGDDEISLDREEAQRLYRNLEK